MEWIGWTEVRIKIKAGKLRSKGGRDGRVRREREGVNVKKTNTYLEISIWSMGYAMRNMSVLIPCQ